MLVGIARVASVLLAAGLLPPYGEIWKRRGRVIGIKWIRVSLRALSQLVPGSSTSKLTCREIFSTMDCSGAFLSLTAHGMHVPVSVSHPVFLWIWGKGLLITNTVAQNTFDVLGGVLYIIW